MEMKTYKEDEYVPGNEKVYRVQYKDGATYQYSPGHSSLVENISPEVLEAQRNASRTTPAKSTGGIEWFEGAGCVMFTILVLLPIAAFILIWGVYPAILLIFGE